MALARFLRYLGVFRGGHLGAWCACVMEAMGVSLIIAIAASLLFSFAARMRVRGHLSAVVGL